MALKKIMLIMYTVCLRFILLYMTNYSLTALSFCLLIMVGCATVPPNEESSLIETSYLEQTEAHEEQQSKSKDLDSDERKIEAAILASAEKDFKTVTRIDLLTSWLSGKAVF